MVTAKLTMLLLFAFLEGAASGWFFREDRELCAGYMNEWEGGANEQRPGSVGEGHR